MFNLQKYEKFFLGAILIFVIVFSLSYLTTRPKLWFDEGLTIEIARNFLLFGKMDISTAPNVFSGLPYVVGTNGYPLTIPLAGVFSIFDFGLRQARLYMIFWLVAAVFSVYFFVKSTLGVKTAITASALIASFAPFYANGLTVTGEIPGFFFLIWGLFFLIKSERANYFLAGMFFALAGVSKPSIYLLLFPSLLIFLILMERKDFLMKLFKIALGAIPPFLVWIFLAFPNPLFLSTWKAALSFYKNPHGNEFFVWRDVLNNLFLIPTSSTLIYFTFLSALVVYWFFTVARFDAVKKKFSSLLFIYGFFSLLYFLKSPGWFRYLIGFQFLIFIFIFPAAAKICQEFFKKKFFQKSASAGLIIVILLIHLFSLFFYNQIPFSPYPERMADFINRKIDENPDYKIGIINLPAIAGLIHPLRKFHTVKTAGKIPAFGANPLSFSNDSLPQFIAFKSANEFVDEYINVLNDNYILINNIGGYKIYELK